MAKDPLFFCTTDEALAKLPAGTVRKPAQTREQREAGGGADISRSPRQVNGGGSYNDQCPDLE
jgi:hypothetical protein